MTDKMKDSIQMGLLVVIAVTVIYGTFLKEDPIPRRTATAELSQPQSTMAAQSNTNPLNPTIQPQPQQAQPQQPQRPPTSVSFAKMAHDFGTIQQDTENEHVFAFTNTGDKPLIIESATGSCGCTVPEYPKEPIAPGAEGEIRVVYKPGKQKGNQTKTVTIMANTEPRETRLNITAQVQEVEG